MMMRGRFRNSPCPCGSGKKLKKCCGKTVNVPLPTQQQVLERYVDQFKPDDHTSALEGAEGAEAEPVNPA